MGTLPKICENQSDQLSLPCQGFMKQLVSCKAVREVPAQHVIHSQGEIIHNGYFICEGLVKVSHVMPDGKRMIVAVRRGGWVPGLGSIVGKFAFPNTAETITRCKLRSFSPEQFRQLMETDARFASWVARLLASAFYGTSMKMIEKSLLSGRERLEKFIWEMAESTPHNGNHKNIKMQSVLKRWEIAQLLSLTPQHLARLTKEMEDEGILKRQKGWFILMDPERLRRPGLLVPPHI